MDKVRYPSFERAMKLCENVVSMSDVTKGRTSEGRLADLLDRPKLKLFGVEKYDTIYKKAACLLEGFCRGHILTDGNKRISIAITRSFLELDNLYFVVSLDAMRFIREFAQDESVTEEDVNHLINEIAKWIEERSGTFDEMYKLEAKYVLEPIIELLEFLSENGDKKVNSVLSDWFDEKKYFGEDTQTTMNHLIVIFKQVYKELKGS